MEGGAKVMRFSIHTDLEYDPRGGVRDAIAQGLCSAGYLSVVRTSCFVPCCMTQGIA